jgi:nucleoside-diphosphate-sugar epimerase
MRYVVTGGAGFIGSHLVEHLVGAGHDVVVLDDFSTGKRENLAPWLGRIELVEGSVTDPDVCARAIRGADYVLHQAALPSVPRSVRDPVASHAVNATGTLMVLLAARDAKVKRVVYAASSSAYGNTPELPKREDMVARPLSPYAVAKLAGEQYCRAVHASFGVPTVALRYFNVFGPRQDPTSQYAAVIPKFITAALAGEGPTIFGDGEQTRDFTFIANVVRANLLACDAPPAAFGEVCNVGCGERISVNELWRRIRKLAGASVEARYEPTRTGDVRDSLASLDRARALLGYEPVVSVDEGLRRTLEDWIAVMNAKNGAGQRASAPRTAAG